MRIKVLGNSLRVEWSSFSWPGGYEFVCDPSCTDYDWLVVYDELPSRDRGTVRHGFEELRCPRERTILATWEPVSVKYYSRAYTRQFGHLLSNRPPEAERHPHYHLGRGYYLWFCGRMTPTAAAVRIGKKEKLISVVCSAKQMRHTKHFARFKLVEAIARDIPELDWYGHGVRHIDNKLRALDPYCYHIAAENHIGVHHWSEKVADAWLCECLPFYAGDPDLGNVMPKESFIPIPIDNPKEASRIIREAIAAGEYERRREAVLEAKRLILEKYNFWAQVVSVIEAEREQCVTPVDPLRPARIYARKALRWHSLSAALEDAAAHVSRFFGR